MDVRGFIMKDSIISLKNVWKTYHMGEVNVNALCNVSLDIKKGEFVVIVGPSGSGKSTMMNLVGCLDLPTKGRVFLDGRDIMSLSESQLATTRGKKIGFVFQQFNLIPTLSAIENVMLPLEFQDVETSRARERAAQMLEIVDLKDRMHHLPSQLSGGQMQRVAIARALAPDPEIILADEPTGNLDSKTGEFIIDFLLKIHKKERRTIIIVTHDSGLTRHAEKVIHIKDGMVEKTEIKGG
jgi:putative ABC transport system ATP-binding protein